MSPHTSIPPGRIAAHDRDPQTTESAADQCHAEEIMRVRPGYKSVQAASSDPTPPRVNQRRPTFPQATGHPYHEGPVWSSPSRPTSASAVPHHDTMRPRRAGSLRMADTNAKPRLGRRGGGGCGIPSHADLPKGYRGSPRARRSGARVDGSVGNPGRGRISCLTTESDGEPCSMVRLRNESPRLHSLLHQRPTSGLG
jgi:hypothetical protein